MYLLHLFWPGNLYANIRKIRCCTINLQVFLIIIFFLLGLHAKTLSWPAKVNKVEISSRLYYVMKLTQLYSFGCSGV